MNSHREFDDSRQLDRLVDGEMSADEYRGLLAKLDKEPDGWRRCAIAFLEAQAWEQELGPLQEDPRLARGEESSQRVGRSKSNWSTRQVFGLLLAMAASFVVTLASVVWWQVDNSPNSEPDLATVARLQGDSRPKELTEEVLYNPNPDGVPTQHLTFVVDRDDGLSDRFELPIYDANDSVARQLLRDSSSMPAYVERAIRDSGFQVKRQRQWAPVRLRDGRRAFFPVDQFEITPVSGNIYH